MMLSMTAMLNGRSIDAADLRIEMDRDYSIQRIWYRGELLIGEFDLKLTTSLLPLNTYSEIVPFLPRVESADV